MVDATLELDHLGGGCAWHQLEDSSCPAALSNEQQVGLGIFTCAKGPEPFIGFSLTTGTYQPVTGICSMWNPTYWLAQRRVDSHTCVVKQIGASIQCTAGNTMAPDEAGCWPDKCNEYCSQKGQSGSCDGAVCRCH